MLLPASQDQMSYIIGPSTRMLFAQVRDAREPIRMPVINRRMLGMPMYGRRVLRGNTAAREPSEVAKPALVIASTHLGVRHYSFSVTGVGDGWLWDFGDGSTGTGATPEHTYAAAGNYDVSVVVLNGFDIWGRYLYADFPVDNSAPVNDFVPDTGAGTGPTDAGISGRSHTSWSEARLTPDTAVYSDPTGAIFGNMLVAGVQVADTDGVDPGNWEIQRGLLRFDTSLISAPPVSGYVRLLVSSEQDDLDDGASEVRLYVLARTPPERQITESSSPYPSTDWDDLTAATVPASDDVFTVDDAGVLVGSTFDFTLNAAGLAAVNADGHTCFALRINKDVDDDDPTVDSSDLFIYATFNSAEQASDKPTLHLEFS